MIELKVNEKRFVGWTDVKIIRSINQACSTFSFTATQHPDNLESLKDGTKCEVFFNNNKLITGIIDSLEVSYSKNDHQISVNGRSKTKDLVDCSVIAPFQFQNLSIKRLTSSIAGIYNIVVKSSDDSTIISNFQIEQNGESCFKAIERVSQTKALRITDNNMGDLVLTQASPVKSKNVIDENTKIFSASLKVDESQKYSKITVKGQSKTSSTWYGKNASQIVASATDETVDRKRELLLISKRDTSNQDAKKLAEWEIASRSAKSFELNYKIQGWASPNLFFENTLINVKDKILKIDDEYLITTVTYELTSTGSFVILTLVDPNSLQPQPVIKKTKRKSILGWYK